MQHRSGIFSIIKKNNLLETGGHAMGGAMWFVRFVLWGVIGAVIGIIAGIILFFFPKWYIPGISAPLAIALNMIIGGIGGFLISGSISSFPTDAALEDDGMSVP